MSISDVWRNIDKHLSVYVKGNFDQVPSVSGVYAWFYPLKVATTNLDDLIKELKVVQNYDAKTEGLFISDTDIPFKWDELNLKVEYKIKNRSLPDDIYQQWESTIKNDADLLEVRKTLMSASILMPPLYIGKTSNLRNRCSQHINTDKKGCFTSRFEDFACSRELTTQSVNDLIFVTILAGNNKSNGFKDEQSLIEEILKAVAKPSYGKS